MEDAHHSTYHGHLSSFITLSALTVDRRLLTYIDINPINISLQKWISGSKASTELSDSTASRSTLKWFLVLVPLRQHLRSLVDTLVSRHIALGRRLRRYRELCVEVSFYKKNDSR